MTINQTDQQEGTFNIADIGAKFGAQEAITFSNMIRLEQKVAVQQAQIQQLAQSEAARAEHIEDLEDELGELRVENTGLQERIKYLETEMDGMISAAVTPGEGE